MHFVPALARRIRRIVGAGGVLSDAMSRRMLGDLHRARSPRTRQHAQQRKPNAEQRGDDTVRKRAAGHEHVVEASRGRRPINRSDREGRRQNGVTACRYRLLELVMRLRLEEVRFRKAL